ncbi:MAG TPA: hypothetical protein VK610_08700 [Rhodothermales bacterium]|nr:hypothetical protein [Rhodothermales bacterium]
MSTPSRALRGALLPLLFLGALVTLQGCAMGQAGRTTYGSSGTGTAAVTMANRTNIPVHFVYISSCSTNSWGEDQLGSSETVSPGANRTFTMSPGCWDLKARFSDGREVEERQVYMTAGGTRTWTLTN